MSLSPPIRNRPQGLTLIEMLIGMAITLVMMAAVVTLFANLGAGVRVQKAAMDISGQLRTTRAQLYKDLAGATCDGIPKSNGDDDLKADGYIEIVE
ncbi:MAG: prepilin-type N-terminal cleavage/methylation domain-containing protein, partial [Planctomycetes bacterium]|nr:prepilin-type N-terminal cleavage/methylation domain-containing protein [Planctomycetota bacterium]